MPTKAGPRSRHTGPTVYSVEAVLLAAVGYAWLEGCQSITGVAPQLDTLAFTVTPVAALASLALSTLVTTKSVQLVFMSLLMGLTAAYTYVLAEALTPVPVIAFGNSTNTTNMTSRPQAYVDAYLGGMTLFQPFAAISLGLLCVQTLVAAAPVSRCMWDTPLTGPTVMICTLLVTPLWPCNYWTILALGGVACVEAALGSPWEDSEWDPRAPQPDGGGVWTTRIVVQAAGALVRGYLGWALWGSLGATRTAPLVAAGVFVGVPVLVSGVNLLRSLKAALLIDATPPSPGPSRVTQPLAPTPPPIGLAPPPPKEPGAMPAAMSACFTTEAALFRPSEASAMWHPKKTR